MGQALACHEGQEVRVSGGIPGEEVVAEVIKHRQEYIAAQVVEVLTPSPHRVEPPCAYFGPCTGCQWQHVEYPHQLHVKRRMVVDALVNVSGFAETLVLSTLPSPEQYGYRNHARFTVGRRKGELGFVNRESRRFIVIQECLLMHPWINEALGQLQGKCAETSQLSIRYGVNTNDFLIQPAMKSPEVPLQSGRKYYAESLDGHEYRIAASSFFQVNTRQAERMMELVRDELHVSKSVGTLQDSSTIVDAYAGVGTFAIMLAPYAGKVLAIEESNSAVRDARINAQGIEGVQFLEGKAEEVLAQLEERPQGVILDPPRAGCHRDTLDALIRLAPRRVVYVSCDPDTLARDLEILCDGPFRLERVRPVDMFPQTHHVECIASLSLEGRNL
jgi:23S rRNA (uracil1939-C5)-methyltransferase